MKVSGIYKIINTATGNFYIGSSKDVKRRWACHKCPSYWKRYPNNPLYKDMQKYGVDKFAFEILAEAESEYLKVAEQQFIEKMHPAYNSNRANGWDVERRKEYIKEYQQSNKYKDYQREYMKEYNKSGKHKKSQNKYNNQLCYYNGKSVTLAALRMRFKRAGIAHPTIEAKKYLIL